jgi:hypothetical protein
MRFIQIGAEDETSNGEEVELNPNETAQAIAAVDNQNSTEPAKVIQVANYKEEVAALRAENKDKENQDDTSVADTNTDANGGDTSAPVDNAVQDDEQTETPTDGAKPDEEDVPSDDVEQTPGTAELGQDAPGKTDEEVAQEDFIVQGHKMALEAIDGIQEMAKYHDFIKKRSKLGGINPQTAEIITKALENHSVRCGYTFDKKQVPSLENYASYSGAEKSTRELSVAIESFLSATWDAIKKFFKSVWKWIEDILTGGKSGKPDSVQRPQTKQTRDKSIRDLELKINDLKDKLKSNDKLRDKDLSKGKTLNTKEPAKLPKELANVLFKNNDEGTFQEVFENGLVLAEVTDGFTNLTKFFDKASKNFAMGIANGENNGLGLMVATKDTLGAVALEKTVNLPDDLLVEGFSKEIAGGVQACFTFAKSGYSFEKLGLVKSCAVLGKQGMSFVSDKKEQNVIVFPELSENNLSILFTIVNEIKKSYNNISASQVMLTACANVLNDTSNKGTPESWSTFTEEQIAELKAQAMFMATLNTSMTASYKKLENQVNIYKDAIDKLIAFYSK